MKVILLEDVKTVGKKGEIVDVSDGYARNVLIRKGQAKQATGKNMNDLKLQQANAQKMAQEALDAARKLGEEMHDKTIKVAVKTGEGGRIFGSVSSKEIAEELKAQLNYDVDKKKIQLDTPLKALGMHTVEIKLHPQVTTSVFVLLTEA